MENANFVDFDQMLFKLQKRGITTSAVEVCVAFIIPQIILCELSDKRHVNDEVRCMVYDG